ncbi:MAG: hypothetical protein AMXMBFR84_27050 [Candidatus Hydrogenedentota bacterium]
MIRIWPVFLCAAILFVAPAASAQEDADCFMCHAEPDITKTLESGVELSMYIDKEVYDHSVHNSIGCTSCHADITELPHPENLAPVNCGTCHAETEEYEASLHGRAMRAGDPDSATCAACHGKHDMRPADDPLSMVHPFNLAKTCGECHSDPAIVKSHMISVAHPSDSYLKSIHAKALFEDNNLEAAVCNDCHGTHNIEPSQDPRSPVNRQNVPQTCAKCHAETVEEFNLSIHGKALAAGIKDAPNCTDCHGEHDIEPSTTDSSPVSLQNVARMTCPQCHEDEKVMSRYGIETMRSASYMDSYHGMASRAGSTVVATCTSCHGVHNILGASDPKSSIHPANLVQTCSSCHKEAGPNFAVGKVHIMPTDPGQKALGIVRIVYLWLIALILGSMILHNLLLMMRHLLAKLFMERRAKDKYRRFNKGEVIGHFLLFISFTVLAISGFALRYPDTWFTQLMFFGDKGLAFRGIVHREAAVLFCFVMGANLLYILLTRRGRGELWALMLRWKDAQDIAANLKYISGLSDVQPKYDRYSYKEKLEYWGLWWGSILMIVTGFCMWFANDFLAHFPKVALDILALIHFYEAWLAVGTIVVWHLFYMILDPETYPMNWSWVTGHITKEDFKERHPIEYKRVTGEDPHPESAKGDAP